ncbi:hypothetical protein LWI28_026335 [Acer negundo]|uniref:Uncharacterized protein n=1 Tax=Acer negundo TaxID=4023 RepID=A0AAD5P511_ACENE|nr:hypothetical protein LWI28_026335 [Acer negundo]
MPDISSVASFQRPRSRQRDLELQISAEAKIAPLMLDHVDELELDESVHGYNGSCEVEEEKVGDLLSKGKGNEAQNLEENQESHEQQNVSSEGELYESPNEEVNNHMPTESTPITSANNSPTQLETQDDHVQNIDTIATTSSTI